MPGSLLRIFFHDRCFDGATSAALFAEFHRSVHGSQSAIEYWGMAHTSGDPFADIPWDANENACVDFRYCADPRMHWWFDHHQSAFQPTTLREHFLAQKSEQHFYDPGARSCALFVEAVLAAKFGFEVSDTQGHWRELLDWADKVDGAVFSSAAEIVELEHPALKFMIWLRNNRSAKKMSKTIEQMGKKGMEEMVALEWIAGELPDLLDAHFRSVELIATRLHVLGDVVVYDLVDDEVEAHSGFAAYLHSPAAKYSVGIARAGAGTSISVGRNPWAADVGTINIAELCEEYGGGGHPNVGGISLPAGELVRARQVVHEISEKLSGTK